MRDDNCIFCKLANGEIPTATLYEDEDFRVILDASPASRDMHSSCRKNTMRICMSWTTKLRQRHSCLRRRW